MSRIKKTIVAMPRLFPIRCATCGALINDLHEPYLRLVAELDQAAGIPERARIQYLSTSHCEKSSKAKALDHLNITSLCCRNAFLTHPEDA